jgi:hypothetical protein
MSFATVAEFGVRSLSGIRVEGIAMEGMVRVERQLIGDQKESVGEVVAVAVAVAAECRATSWARVWARERRLGRRVFDLGRRGLALLRVCCCRRRRPWGPVLLA